MGNRVAQKRGVFGRLRGVAGRPAIIGAIIAVIAVPLLAVASAAGSSAIADFDALPTDYQLDQQPQINRINAITNIDADGTKHYKTIATVYSQNRKSITWDDVTPTLKGAVLAAEDARFYDHGGIDVQGIVRAGVTDVLTHSSAQGASTLTQQVVKNLCIAQAFKDYPNQAQDKAEYAKYVAAVHDCNEGTIDRKLREMKYAIALEKNYSKNDILLAYLNVANFGGTVYGIEAAAKRYYNTDATELTVEQAASLIAIVQLPEGRRLDVKANYAANTQRRDYIINRMASLGYITDADRDKALAIEEGGGKDGLDIQIAYNGCLAADQVAKQFCDYVVKNVKNFAALGDSAEQREANWRIGGYTLYTTLDIRLQSLAQKTVRKYAPANEKALQLGSVADVVQPGTGRVLAMAQNKSFDDSGAGDSSTTAVNYSTDQAYGGSSGFQPGSSYKVFTLINWLANDHGLEETVNGTARTFDQSQFTDTCYPDYDNGSDHPWSGPYQLNNNEGGHGYMTVRQATAQSVNAAFATMAEQLDACNTKKYALALGIHRAASVKSGNDGPYGPAGTTLGPDDLSTNPSAILGIDNIAPLTVAAAYAGIAASGTYCKPIVLDKVVGPSGNTLEGQKPSCKQAIDSDLAVGVQSALQSAEDGYPSNPHDGVEHIAKTGTTNGAIQTWVTTASKGAALTVWFGNVTGSYNMRNYAGGTGGTTRHTIAGAILPLMDQLYPGKDFAEPETKYLTGVTYPVQNYIGLKPSEAKAKIAAEGIFNFDSEVGTVASDLPKGTIARQTPGAGSRATKGSFIQVWVSDGSQSALPDVTTQGYTFEQAQAQLQTAGFTNVTQYCVATSTDTGGGDGNGDGDGTGNGGNGNGGNGNGNGGGVTLPDPDPTPTDQPTTPDGIVVESSPKAGTVVTRTSEIKLGVTAQTC